MTLAPLEPLPEPPSVPKEVQSRLNLPPGAGDGSNAGVSASEGTTAGDGSRASTSSGTASSSSV